MVSTDQLKFRLYLLGSFRLESIAPGSKGKDRAQAIDLPTRKNKVLLAYLALHPEAHPREKLAALIWGDSTDEQARNSLRNTLSVLRRTVDAELLIVDREAVQMRPGFPLWVDAVEFERQAREVMEATEPGPEGIDLKLYRGDLLTEYYDEWILAERERYRLLYLDVLLRMTQTARSQSEYGRAIECAQLILRNDIANERAHQHLMFAHLASGNRTAALKQYDECRRALESELAVAPMEETTALYEWIRQAEPEGKALEPKLTNLPIPVSSFIGRKGETAEIKSVLASHRLVTLTGAGGSGKTRLAIHVATDLVDRYRDGVWWIELAPLMDESSVPHVVARMLGVRETATQPLDGAIADYIASRQMLMVLDNCEHMVGGCARLADGLLQRCPNLTILATSREGLGVAGEVTWLVPLLSLPETQDVVRLFQDYEAIRLFEERARAAKSDFQLTEGNVLAVAQICRRLDGIPLAIELAAARVKVLGVEEIAGRLDDRFNLLTTGSRSALPRQQTLRALIDWSHDLLSGEEKVLFRRLAVFHDGRTLEAVEEVCGGEGIERGQVLDVLGRLIDKSLLIGEGRNGGMEYRMLETIRHYAEERLQQSGEVERMRDRHLNHFLRLAETAERNLRGPEQLPWLDRLEHEHSNLRAALEWSRNENRHDVAMRLAASLFSFWMLRGYWKEGRKWLGEAFKSEEVTRARALALLGLAELTSLQDGLAAGTHLYQESLRLFRILGDEWGIAVASSYYLGTEDDPGRAKAIFDESLAIAQKLGDEWLIATVYHRMGIHAYRQKELARSRSFVEQGLSHSRQAGDKWMISSALTNLGEVARGQMDYDSAAALYAEGLAIERELGDKEGSAVTLHNMAYVELHRHNELKAAALFRESLTMHRERGRRRGVAECLAGMANVEVERKRYERATRLLGAAETILETLKESMDLPDQAEYADCMAVLRKEMDSAAFDVEWKIGQGMTMEQIVRLAISDED